MTHDEVARAVATDALGCDPGPLTLARSGSHHVYVGSDVVVKVIAADRHARLDREITLAADLPSGVTAALLGSGVHSVGPDEFRYACYRRVPGVAPGIGMPGVGEVDALRWAGQAIAFLTELHGWAPNAQSAQTLRETLDHGGFVTRDGLLADIASVATDDRSGVVERAVVDGLVTIAERAPTAARTDVPVHADCHWGNWLVDDRDVTALLDFEWARFGEPVDDWFFLARFSGPHRHIVLELIAHATSTPADVLRAECEVREAAYLTSDLLIALRSDDEVSRAATSQDALDIVVELEHLVIDRAWWPATG